MCVVCVCVCVVYCVYGERSGRKPSIIVDRIGGVEWKEEKGGREGERGRVKDREKEKEGQKDIHNGDM